MHRLNIYLYFNSRDIRIKLIIGTKPIILIIFRISNYKNEIYSKLVFYIINTEIFKIHVSLQLIFIDVLVINLKKT